MYMHVIGTRFTDKHGLFSKAATRRFLKQADAYDPDALWLHNIHGYYINYELLFDWIKKRPAMSVKWTLHDCWTFTGHCAHYMYVGCDKWKLMPDVPDVTHCGSCPLKKQYPASILADNSRDNYLRKKNAFTGIPDMTLVSPSKWLAGEIKQSFMSGYPVEVSYNTIDKDIFKPASGDFRSKHGIIDEEFMILAVSGVWHERKGLCDLLRLSDMIKEKCLKMRLVIVGLTHKQAVSINRDHPEVICIEHTESPAELAEIYTAADAFINPTYEDNYPTVNLEAESCGTPVITYDTGGCAETVHRPDSRVIKQDVRSLFNELESAYENKVTKA